MIRIDFVYVQIGAVGQSTQLRRWTWSCSRQILQMRESTEQNSWFADFYSCNISFKEVNTIRFLLLLV